ncbi:MAG: ABC transporter ATP-binding protein [Chloroflexi bacterium]|nr:ABC transporter ATP-binding protein [Chloroflexota bacterium]
MGRETRSPSPHLPISPAALHARDLSFAYSAERVVLHGLNLTIAPGERVGVIGPNGAGKTTLFHLFCGVLAPSGGVVELFGEQVRNGRFHPQVGLLFQNPDDQLFSPSVWDDVAFGPQNLGLSPADVQARVASALALTGTTDLAQRPPHHLSGGEKRMVSIAGVLAMQPRLVIYDEPSANLDIRARRRLIRFLQNTSETMLISAHDLELILEVCDRVLLLDEGCIIADGPPRQVMDDVTLMEAHGLERPHSLTPHSHR